MSLYCAISGQPPLNPVLSVKSGVVYEHDLITKYIKENGGKDPITGDELTTDDLVTIKTAPSTPSAPPRAPSFTSVPSILHTLQNEWDACMLECLELRRQGDELRQELSHALYKEDASMRVLARLTRERDEARDALASVQATLGHQSSAAPAPTTTATTGDDVEMDSAAAPHAGLPQDAKNRVDETNKSLSATRKKRKAPQGYATQDDVKTFVQTQIVPSLHTTKPPGISALDVVGDGTSFVTGGNDKNVQLYNRKTGKIVANLKGHTKAVTAVLASTNLTDDELAIPTHIVSASLDKSVRVWVPNGKKAVYECGAVLSTGGEVNGLAFHPSQTLVASGSSDGTWSIHDLQPASGGKPATVLTGSLPEGLGATAIAFHPDGAIFAVGSTDSHIRIFDTNTGSSAATFDGHSAEQGAAHITSLSFSENGYTLASAAQGSQEVKLWDLRKLTNGYNIALDSAGAGAGAGGAVVVRFDRSAQYLAIVGTDVRVYGYASKDKVWNLLCQAEDNAGQLTGVAWGANGDELLVAGQDRTVRVLAKPERAADEAEAETGAAAE